MIECFSQSYPEARDKFLNAARKAGASLSHHVLNQAGPDGGSLSTDVAFVGPPDARAVRKQVFGDLLWALMSGPEFQFNH